jgi:multisubunit Na+/H+ antiporter MnhC subunit
LSDIEDRAWAMVLVALVIGSSITALMLRGIG